MDKMQPPSGFSFVGLAEIVKEFRELIKDLTYRNKHETLLCEIEICEKLSCFKEKIGQTKEQSVLKLAASATDGLRNESA